MYIGIDIRHTVNRWFGSLVSFFKSLCVKKGP